MSGAPYGYAHNSLANGWAVTLFGLLANLGSYWAGGSKLHVAGAALAAIAFGVAYFVDGFRAYGRDLPPAVEWIGVVAVLGTWIVFIVAAN